MAEHSEAGTAGGTVLSRRDAIVGALALAAGALIAQKPEPALAANGSTVMVGLPHTGNLPTVLWHTVSGNIGPVLSQALFAGQYNEVEYGVEGEVTTNSSGQGTGVRGLAGTVLQTGVLAQNTAVGGTALRVVGAASFSRSGINTIAKGTTFRTVSGLSGIGPAAKVLATLQGSAGTGVYILYAERRSTTQIRVHLNKAATTTTARFAWIILD